MLHEARGFTFFHFAPVADVGVARAVVLLLLLPLVGVVVVETFVIFLI